MFEDLEKYKSKNHFTYTPKDELSKICDAPDDKSGVYLVFDRSENDKQLIYIGLSGKMQNDGTMKNRENGLKGRIVKGKQFGRSRKSSWPKKMIEDGIEVLDVYWYVTFDLTIQDIPAYVEGLLLQRFFEMHGRLPKWNNEF